MSCDVVIIGAGIVGAACADKLTAEGLKVCVIDGPGSHSPATSAGMGHIVVMDDTEAQLQLTKYSQALWNELSDELPQEAEFSRCGTIWIAAGEDELEEAEKKRGLYSEHGIEAVLLDESSLLEAEPGLRKGLAGAVLVPGDSVVYQPAASEFLLRRAVSKGAKLVRNTVISTITDGAAEDWSGERFEADALVIAAGNESGLLPELSGKIRPRKGHLVITERLRETVSHQLIELGYTRSAHGSSEESVAFNIQPRKTGQLLIGSSRQYGAENGSVDIEVVRKMMARAIEYYPAAGGAYATRIWTGFRPATEDGLPYIGKIPGCDRTYAATGHEGLGITTSLGTASLIADELLGRNSAIPRGPYSPSRIDG